MTNYLLVLKRLGWLLVVLPLLGALVALGVSRVQAPTYEARATVLIRPTAPLNAIDVDAKNLNTAEILDTNALLMTQPALLHQVIGELSLRRSDDELAQQVAVKAQPNTTALIVTVHDTSPQVARDVANRLVTDYMSQGDHIRQQQLDQYASRIQERLTATQKAVSEEQVRLTALQAVTVPNNDQLAQRASLQQQIQADQTHYSDLVQSLATVEAQSARSTDSPIFVSPAPLPATPISPNRRLNVTIGAFGGVLLAMLAIVLLAPTRGRRESRGQGPDDDLDGRREPEWTAWPARHRSGERPAALPARRRSGRGQTSTLHGDAPEK